MCDNQKIENSLKTLSSESKLIIIQKNYDDMIGIGKPLSRLQLAHIMWQWVDLIQLSFQLFECYILIHYAVYIDLIGIRMKGVGEFA